MVLFGVCVKIGLARFEYMGLFRGQEIFGGVGVNYAIDG